MGWAKIRTFGLVSLWTLVLCGISLAAGSGTYEILSQGEDGIAFTVRLPHYRLDTLSYEGVEYVRPFAVGLVSFAEEGAPDLPVFSVLLAVPPGADARLVSVALSGGGSIDGVRVAPIPRIEATGEGNQRFATYIYAEDKAVYGSSSAFPERAAWLTDHGTLRHQDVVRVLISPFAYAPLESRLSYSDEVTVTVAFEGGALMRGGPRGEDMWEDVYRDALLNYDQGKSWRRVQAPMQKSEAVTHDRVKVLVDKTGIYRLGYGMLASLGFPAGVAVGDIMVYRDTFAEGSPDPVEMEESAIEVADNDANGVFSAGDTVSFYALDFYDQFGRRDGADYFFDKNVYWLSWSAGERRRMESRSGWREGVSPQTPAYFTDIIHEEEDVSFVNFPPTDDIDFYTWQRWRADLNFALPGLDSLVSASLITNFVSFYSVPEGRTTSGSMGLFITSCTTPQTRIATFTINVPSEFMRTTAINPGVLCSHGNTFRFESSLPSSWTPGHQLDWFEVAYARKYQAYDDMLAFDNGGVSGEVEYHVTGFSQRDIFVYDVTDSIMPTPIDIDPGQITDDGGAFTLTFRDSVAGRRAYLALCSSRAIEPGAGAVSLVGPPALREATGEYLIVSHPDFVEALDPLVARREAQGFSVVLATTDEVYDDFGNGAKSDTAIRRFAEYAFYDGDAQFLLLVGDANVDRRGLLLVPPPGQLASDVDYVPSHNLIFKDDNPYNKEIRPSENWFAFLGGPNDRFPDIYVGRLPADNAEELTAMINKIATFEDYAGPDPWKKRLLFVADDYYRAPSDDATQLCVLSGETSFESACDSVSTIVKNYALVPVDTVKYYLRWCTNGHEPQLRAQGLCVDMSSAQAYTRAHCTPELISLLDSGALIANFQGHSNHWQFTYETLLRDDFYYKDVRDLSNAHSPFMFLGFGCWMSDFQRQTESASFIGECLAEKFLKNSGGGACMTFASACAEYISENERVNPFVIRALFTHLQGRDPEGNPIAARVLSGEAVVTALLRYGSASYGERLIYLGDPAMVVDLGPPVVSLTANGTPVVGSYAYTGDDTLRVAGEIKDEEAIMAINLDLVEGNIVTPVPPDSFTVRALVDTAFTRSRAYEITYDHVPVFGDYLIRVGGDDYVGKTGTGEIRIRTGSATFFVDADELEEGGPLVFGQELRIVVNRFEATAEGDIQASVDSIPASEFTGYTLKKLDADGKKWEVSFSPSLDQGEHTVTVRVGVLSASRNFKYVPARVEIFADSKRLYDNDYVSPVAEFGVEVEAGSGVTAENLGVKLDGEDVPAAFSADSTGMVFSASFGVDLEPGEHEIAISVFDVAMSTIFRVSDTLVLSDVSVYPSPFSHETYFFYTLSQDAGEVRLRIYTVSGRLIFEEDLPNTAGYNEYRWDGRDLSLDRIANGTYLYKIVAKTGSRERESSGWVVRVE
jgi:hypothetical protein